MPPMTATFIPLPFLADFFVDFAGDFFGCLGGSEVGAGESSGSNVYDSVSATVGAITGSSETGTGAGAGVGTAAGLAAASAEGRRIGPDCDSPALGAAGLAGPFASADFVGPFVSVDWAGAPAASGMFAEHFGHFNDVRPGGMDFRRRTAPQPPHFTRTSSIGTSVDSVSVEGKPRIWSTRTSRSAGRNQVESERAGAVQFKSGIAFGSKRQLRFVPTEIWKSVETAVAKLPHIFVSPLQLKSAFVAIQP